MAEKDYSIVKLGEFAEPAKVLIEKVSDAVGEIFKPYQIRRVAKAEADAEKIKAIGKIEINELEQRALKRLLKVEAFKQGNIENIARKALPHITETSTPEKIEKDWLIDFFEKSKLVSDDEMQNLWAKVLAGEADKPGSFSKRTLYLLSSLDKKDAQSFEKLSSFVWSIGDIDLPLILNTNDPIYTTNGITFIGLKQLDSLGLISFDSISGYSAKEIGKRHSAAYRGKLMTLEFLKESGNELNLGKVIFTNAGLELSRMCHKIELQDLQKYILGSWQRDGIVTQELPKKSL